MERNHTSSRISPGAVRYSELHQQEPSSTSLDIGPSTSCGSSSKDQATPSKTNIEEIPSTSPSKTSTKEGTSRGFKSLIVLRWWLPELIASILSIASSISIVVILRNYDGRGLDNLSLPRGLTLNGIIAALSTLNRVCLMTPVGTAMSQEAWLWFSATGRKRSSRLGDLDLSDAASRGSWGSLVFLWSSRGHR
jgi:hypothetical protein